MKHVGHELYPVWASMRDRCNNPKSAQFKDYGGRGIRVCERWNSFPLFVADMGERPPGHTLERRDNSMGYEPGNCRWATRAEQNRNMRSNVWYDFRGQKLLLVDIAKRTGKSEATLRHHLNAGMSIEEAIIRRRAVSVVTDLTDRDLLEIRGLVNSGLTQQVVATHFGVSQSFVSGIARATF